MSVALESRKELPITISWHTDIREIDAAEWSLLAETLDTPLLDFEWLRQMEVSGSVAPEQGWLPCHLVVRRDNTMIAAAPLYIKGHSHGEFVWDYMWADVASQLDVKYYPKLIGMSPATPAVGYRFLIAPGENETDLTKTMLSAIDSFCEANDLSGCNFHFVDPEWGSILAESGYSGWLHQSFEWTNPDYSTFEDYLAGFTKNQRRNIRRERRSVAEAGIRVEAFTGNQIPDEFYPLMWRYYERTNDQFGPWAAKYLTEEFFADGLAACRDHLVFVAAFDENLSGATVALSMLLTKDQSLIGRYWGAERMIDSLHFDACYYMPIEWAIEHGVRRFDPGAGSPHKLRRGFFAVGNYSYHRFRDPTMRGVMHKYLGEINSMEQQRIDEMNKSVPVKKPPSFRNSQYDRLN